MASLRPGAVHPPGQGDTTRSQRGNGGRMLQGPDYGRVPRRELEHARTPTTSLSSSSLSPASSLLPPATSTRSPSAASRIPQTSSTAFAPPTALRRFPDDRTPRSHTRPPLSHQQQPKAVVGSSAASGPSRSHAMAPASYDTPKQYPLNTPADSYSASTGPVQRGKVSGVRPHRSNPGETRSTPSGARTHTQTSRDMERALTASPAELHQIVKKAQVTIYPELDRYRNTQALLPASDDRGTAHPDILFRLATQDLPPPPTPHFSGSNSLVSAMSGSPSTRFSESPGPSPYSRDTTPTSMSSHSPGLVVSSARMPAPRVRPIPRTNTGSFGKDAISKEARMDIPGPSATHSLAAIRESLNSSSSSSNGTIRGGEKREKTKKKRLTPPPPSPPPRKSSQKFKKLGDDQVSPSKPKQLSSRPTQSSKRLPQPESTRPPRIEPPSSKAVVSPNPANETSPPPPARAIASPPLSTSAQQRRIAASPRLTQRPTPPTRPSRDGTPDLQSQMGFVLPVIQSNLTSTSLSNRRTSLHAVSSSPPPGRGQQLSFQQKRERAVTPIFSQSQQQENHGETTSLMSTAPASTSNLPVTTRTHSSQGSWDEKEPGRAPRTVSPGVSTFRTRFPLFSRRAKAVASPDGIAPAVETRDKSARKGPSAGTGYEGYGRPGHSRRRSSSVSEFFRSGGTASSQDNLNGLPPDDAFLRDRMSPVVIAGGEVVENYNISDLELSAFRRPSTDSRNGSEVSLSSREGRTTLWPSALQHGPRPGSSRSRRPSDSSDSEAVMRSTLAYRRSVQRLRSPDRVQVRVPRPIVVRSPAGGVNQSMSSLDTSVLTDDSAIPETNRGRKGSFSAAGASSTGTRKLTKRARSPRKWNLFGRTHSQPATAKTGLTSASMVAVTVETALPQEKPKAVAFYAMLDSSEQEEGNLDVEAVLREAQVFGSPAESNTWDERDRQDRGPASGQTRAQETTQLLPPLQLKSAQQSRPRRGSSSSSRGRKSGEQQQQQQKRQHISPSGRSTHAPSHKLPTTTQAGRPSRLAQVGRIPKVVSARPEQTSPKSFSRPFNRVSMQLSTPSPQPGSLNGEWVAKGPSPKLATPELVFDGSTTTGSSVEPPAPNPHHLAQDVESVDHGSMFLSFSPRKNSQSTSCTSSSGLVSFADATAVVPDPSAPLVEDEIWDEYNDLLVDVVSKPPSIGPLTRHARPAVLTRLNQVAAADAFDTAESPTITLHYQGARLGLGSRPPIASSIYSTDMAAEVRDMVETRPAAPAPSQLPPTSASTADSASRSRNQNNRTKALAKQPTTEARRSSASSQKSGRQTARASDGSLYSQVSDDSTPLSQVNLRVGSMTVSKWLTFGHVLFSPARDDMVPAVRPPNGHAVLVLDGLGNDDWSFYAAETYPAVTFFNLSPRAPLPIQDQQTDAAAAFPSSPPNHHQIQYTSYAEKLPFQAEIFTTVVLRFPAAAPEAHYKNIVQEARRVLKPGGYLELSILDLDLNNMGPRTRRAIRRLKEQIHTQAPDMHLGSAADVVLRLLGTKGFTDIKSCRVGIPVASTISQTGSEANVGGAPADDDSGKSKKKDQRSLAEMINDQSPVADENITHMVAKVGRWWHSRCYGDAALELSARPANSATGSRGLWLDRAVLAECEEWRTNLKLMVCYARVPDARRVASI